MSKIYAVRKGRRSGLFFTWTQCQDQIKGYSGAEYKSFYSQQEATIWLEGDSSPTISKEKTSHIQRENPGIIIYTDGSCQRGKGGWAYVVVKNNKIQSELSGSLSDYPTTNNRAELTAILQALIDYPTQDVTIYSDSDYSIKSVTLWWQGWEKRGWRKADGRTPENLDLIQEIIIKAKGRMVNYYHVYGHQGNVFNERCDLLAKEACFR